MGFIEHFVAERSIFSVFTHKKKIIKNLAVVFGLIVPCNIDTVPFSIFHLHHIPHMRARNCRCDTCTDNQNTRNAILIAKQLKGFGISLTHRQTINKSAISVICPFKRKCFVIRYAVCKLIMYRQNFLKPWLPYDRKALNNIVKRWNNGVFNRGVCIHYDGVKGNAFYWE